MRIVQYISERFLPPGSIGIIWIVSVLLAVLIWWGAKKAIAQSTPSPSFQRIRPTLWIVTLLWAVGAEWTVLQALMSRFGWYWLYSLPFAIAFLGPAFPVLYLIVFAGPQPPISTKSRWLAVCSLLVLVVMGIVGVIASTSGIGLRFPGVEVCLLAVVLLWWCIDQLSTSPAYRWLFPAIVTLNMLCTVAAWRYIQFELNDQIRISAMLHEKTPWPYIALSLSGEPATMCVPFALWPVLLYFGRSWIVRGTRAHESA